MKPEIKWVSSPNFKVGKNRSISTVVLHATATSKLASPLEWLTSPLSRVSSHYLIDKDGTIYQLVLERNIAFHAGESFWQGKAHVNNFSVGIELVNPNDGSEYPQEQVQACLDLCIDICTRYRIPSADVVGHLDVALGRKSDPAGFDFEDFRNRLRAAGIA